MSETVLVLNAGSSSLKFAAYDIEDLSVRLRGSVSRIGDGASIEVTRGDDAIEPSGASFRADGDHADHMRWLLNSIGDWLPETRVAALGHRVVHGGQAFSEPVRVDTAILEKLDALSPLAPSHQPHNLAPIRAVADIWPDAPQIACFDTSFHRTQPRLAELFALPRRFADQGVLRYGFHGLSYDYIAARAPSVLGDVASGRVVVAHLGHGASMCAMKGGRSVATTMGFTALDGLMMGKRCGALDPGVVLHLMEEDGLSLTEVRTLLYKESGLRGVSGESDDVRSLLDSETPQAAEALDLFAYRAAREIGSLAAALDGLDALIFTAGIGENSADMRRRICAHCGWLGVHIDDDANDSGGPMISKAGGAASAWVIPTDEEIVIAQAVKKAVD